jgi:hypothetical protein
MFSSPSLVFSYSLQQILHECCAVILAALTKGSKFPEKFKVLIPTLLKMIRINYNGINGFSGNNKFFFTNIIYLFFFNFFSISSNISNNTLVKNSQQNNKNWFYFMDDEYSLIRGVWAISFIAEYDGFLNEILQI